MTLTSPDFQHNSSIPPKFTCQGVGLSPNLVITGAPQGAKSLALIVDDPDAPNGMWVHWVVFNIDPRTTSIAQGTVPGVQGWNDFGRVDWGGPCPPRGTHRYFFKIYALDIQLPLKPGAKKSDVEQAMQGHVLDKAELIGGYKKF
ncbi:MAG: YbhB/YbcL family Raf kinase inhibitor-like protein [Candidatus Omnitrophica bacterium]|nr:YbhB/YbcL family Raf kinase inhibitor-like protein [Candidatus Omnitrophota bacterium]